MLTINDEKSKLQVATGLLEEMSTLQAQIRYTMKMDSVSTIEGRIGTTRYDIYIPPVEELNDGIKKAIGNLMSALSDYYADRLQTTEKQYAELFATPMPKAQTETEPAAK